MAPLKKTASNASTVSLPVTSGAAPGGPIEIVFSFDTTGSMSGCIAEVRKKVGDIIQRLFADIPNLRIAVFAHGDYGDKYVTKHVDFTNDANKLCKFVKTVGTTFGGDWQECYELVLKQTRELLSWSPGTQRAMVMIGDAVPHAVGEARNINNINWEEETEKLRDELGVRIYAVQALNDKDANYFWQKLAKMTYGKHLDLNQFDTIVDMMMAICYREHGPGHFEAYEREVRAREGTGIRNELNRMFDTLRDGATASTTKKGAPTTTLTPGGRRKKPAAGLRKVAITHKTMGRVAKATKRAPAEKKMVKKACKTAAKASFNDDNIKYSIGRQYRETVCDKNFAFNNLRWSPWQPAIVSRKHATNTSTWQPNWSNLTGEYSSRKNFRTKIMRQNGSPAVFELAVRPTEGSKLYPVYARATQNVRGRGERWTTQVLRNRNVRRQICNVIGSDGTVFVRKVRLFDGKPIKLGDQDIKSSAELLKLMCQTYDYPWRRVSRRPCRNVKRNNVMVSSNGC